MGIRYEIEEENATNNTNTNTTSNDNNNNNNNVGSGSKNNAGLRVRAHQLHEDEEDMEKDDEDEEYGEDFNDNSTCFHFFDLFCYCVSFIASNLNDSGKGCYLQRFDVDNISSGSCNQWSSPKSIIHWL